MDEILIRRGDDTVPRTPSGADTLTQAEFAWQTSCRVDRVVRLARDRTRHVERGHLWRGVVDHKLRRCMFGVVVLQAGGAVVTYPQ